VPTLTRMDRDRLRSAFAAAGARHLAGSSLALLASVAALAILSAKAEGQGLRFKHLRSDEGLAGPWVQSITQDSRGFMWFGTSQGLNRYDGYTMQVYRHEKSDPRSLPDNTVLALREDRNGVLWLGTNKGLSRYDRALNSFTSYSLRDSGDTAPHWQVRSILEDTKGNLWVGTTDGLFRFDRVRGVKTRVALTAPNARQNHDIRFLYEDRRGHLLIATHDEGMFDLDPSTRTIRQHAHGQPGATEFPSNNVSSFVEDGQGHLWVTTYDAGLVLLDLRTGPLAVFAHDSRVPASLSTNRLTFMAADRKGWLWIATENGGLEHFDPVTRKFTHVRADPNNPLGVTSDSFHALFVDATGTLWAGSFSGGIEVLRPASDAIQLFSTIVNDTTSLGHNSVLGFAQDSAGFVWIATDGGGLNRLDPATGRVRRFSTKTSNLNRDEVLAASVDSAGRIWVGTWEGGLSVLDARTGRFTAYTSENTNLKDDHIFAVHVDRKQRIWAGSWQRGLMRFDPATRSFSEFHYDTPGVESQIWIIREMHDGRLLLGTLQNGMIIFDPRTSTMTRYSDGPTSPVALAASDVRALLEESPGVIWVGTSSGLDRLDISANTVVHYSVKDGLLSDMISGLAFDRQGDLWVSTDNGIARFDYRSRTSSKYTLDDGLQAREFTARAYLAGRDGTLLFGGNSGFNVIRPELVERNTRKPRIAFTGFQLFNRPVAIGAPGSPLATHISEAKSITLDHTQSVFTFEFAALDFTAPAKNQYAFKLEGFDNDWRHVGTKRTATYTSLAPGRYVFRVKASNNDGVWNEQGASIVIVIVPPFWATWWFRALVTLTVVAIVLALIRRAQKRQQYLQAMNAQLGVAAEHDRESQQYLERNVLDILGAMQQFSAGDYSVALDVASDDAIGKLRSGFNSVVADRKRAEEELRQSQKMEAVGRLAGGVAHDFNNLLTVIKGNAELALADLESNEVVREEIEEIERAAERASSLTRQLLAFSRKQILKPQTLSLNDMVVDIARILRRTVGEDIELKIVLDPSLGSVRADPGQLEQVLLNLVVNARDAMPRGGQLLVETRNIGVTQVSGFAEAEPIPYVAILVTDTGTGMPPAVKDRVFEPFFTTKEQGKGTGLGLSTVYGSVKQSGGFVMVESEPEQGSTFSVYLPRVHDAEELRIAAEVEASPGGSATVLLVEDEDAVRRLASRVLSRSGYLVLAAASGDAAMEIAARFEGTIHLLLTDVVMPGMSGRELAERLMPQHPGMRLLYASGYTEDAIVRHGASSLETEFLEKPFTPNGLLRKVRQVLDAPLPDASMQLAS
jgi:signal transduction histidine kinase/ligand-binding sensor domain-containing protein/ActR/RegA family two-component response regulator